LKEHREKQMNASTLTLSSRFLQKPDKDNHKGSEVVASAATQPHGQIQPVERWQWLLPTVASLIAFAPIFMLANDYGIQLLNDYFGGSDWHIQDGYFLGWPIPVVILTLFLCVALVTSAGIIVQKHRWGAATLFGLGWIYLVGSILNPFTWGLTQCCLIAALTLAVSLRLKKR
jgi:hypothetical protein